MEKLILVDGHNLLFQMFYGIPARIIGKNGNAAHAVLGFIATLLKVIRIIEPSYLLVIFDSEVGSFRTEESPEYKGNRKDYTDAEDDDNPFLQLEDIKKVLEYINIKSYQIESYYETDDIIAAYVKQNKDIDTYILSNDTDFMQLVNENAKLYVYRGKKSIIYDELKVFEKYGVRPNVHADYKALVGDSSDNIKGVPKVGVKTATRLINQYGDIDEIIKNVEKITPPSIKKNIEENIEQLKKNRELILLKGDAPLPFNMEEIAFKNVTEGLKTMDILRETEII